LISQTRKHEAAVVSRVANGRLGRQAEGPALRQGPLGHEQRDDRGHRDGYAAGKEKAM
jgi:hypothetical protein